MRGRQESAEARARIFDAPSPESFASDDDGAADRTLTPQRAYAETKVSWHRYGADSGWDSSCRDHTGQSDTARPERRRRRPRRGSFHEQWYEQEATTPAEGSGDSRQQARSLGKLCITGHGYTDSQLLEHLKKDEGRQKYEEVDFSRNRISSVGLRPVLEAACLPSTLRVLKLYKNEICDQGMKTLAKLTKQCKCIAEIHLSHNHVTAVGVEILVGATHHSRPQSQTPLWLRLEQNMIRNPETVIRDMMSRFNVCDRLDKRCLPRFCHFGQRIHLPHFTQQGPFQHSTHPRSPAQREDAVIAVPEGSSVKLGTGACRSLTLRDGLQATNTTKIAQADCKVDDTDAAVEMSSRRPRPTTAPGLAFQEKMASGDSSGAGAVSLLRPKILKHIDCHEKSMSSVGCNGEDLLRDKISAELKLSGSRAQARRPRPSCIPVECGKRRALRPTAANCMQVDLTDEDDQGAAVDAGDVFGSLLVKVLHPVTGEVVHDAPLLGTYVLDGANHGRPVYHKLIEGEADLAMKIYFWDDADFPGWWFGQEIGGEQVWARHVAAASRASYKQDEPPPRSGWEVVAGEVPNMLLEVLDVSQGAPQDDFERPQKRRRYVTADDHQQHAEQEEYAAHLYDYEQDEVDAFPGES